MSWWTSDRLRYAVNYLVSNAGLSLAGAAGLVSRWSNVEACGGPASVNPSSGAFGIAQWLGARLRPIQGNADFTAQLAYVARELNGSESRAANVLRYATTANEAARGASMYERAEGYNASTGIDNHTARTAAGVAGVLASIGGSSIQPTPIINGDNSDGGGSDNGGIFQDSSEPGATGEISAETLLLIGGGIFVLFLVTR